MKSPSTNVKKVSNDDWKIRMSDKKHANGIFVLGISKRSVEMNSGVVELDYTFFPPY